MKLYGREIVFYNIFDKIIICLNPAPNHDGWFGPDVCVIRYEHSLNH